MSIKPLEVLLAIAGLSLVQACGGRAVDLDRRGDVAAPAPAPSITAGLVVNLPEQITELWLDETRLYWKTSTGALKGCLKDDCADTFITYTAQPGDAAMAGGHVFWNSIADGTIYSCPSSGCDGAPTKVVQDPAASGKFVSADGDYVYWSSTLDIYRCSYAGCGAVPELVAAQEAPLSKLTFQGDNAYWRDDSPPSGNAPGIRQVPKDGSAKPTTIIPVSGYGVATDAANIYWSAATSLGVAGADSPQLAVYRCPLAGCGGSDPVELVSIDDTVSDLRVDASGVYWIQGHGQGPAGQYAPYGSVHSCPLAGCEANGTAVTAASALSFATDDSSVYWIEMDPRQSYSGKTIRRTAK